MSTVYMNTTSLGATFKNSYLKSFLEDSNLRPLREKSERYFCAMPAPNLDKSATLSVKFPVPTNLT